jgi:hypothetical protein
MRQISLGVIFFFTLVQLPAQILDFYKEYITVEIQSDFVAINGVYQLRNNENNSLSMNMYYPFPLDSMYGEIENVYAFEIVNDSTVNKLKNIGGKGALVELEVEAKSEKTLYIGYDQKLKGNKVEYILSSTKKWNKALESSQIELIVPQNFRIESISYQPIDTLISGSKVHYFVRETNFMPVENFVVRFSIAK